MQESKGPLGTSFMLSNKRKAVHVLSIRQVLAAKPLEPCVCLLSAAFERHAAGGPWSLLKGSVCRNEPIAQDPKSGTLARSYAPSLFRAAIPKLSCKPMINNTHPFKGLNNRIPIIIPVKGRGVYYRK